MRYYSLIPNGAGMHNLEGPFEAGHRLAYFKPAKYLSNKEIFRWCDEHNYPAPVFIHNNLRQDDRVTPDMGKLLEFATPLDAMMFKLRWQE